MIAVTRIDPKDAERSAQLGARRVRVQDATAQQAVDDLKDQLAEQEQQQREGKS